MLTEILLALVLAPLASCDTARAALGSCSSQLSTSLSSGQSFQLNLSRETFVSGTQTVQSGGTVTSVTTVPTTNAPTATAPTTTNTSTSTPKATSTPKVTSTPKPTAVAKTAANTGSKTVVAAPTSPVCAVLDPPLARLYMPPCPSSNSAPKPAPKPTAAKPAATRPAISLASPALVAPPLIQTVSSPAVSTRTPSRSFSERDEFAARVPTPQLLLSPGPFRVAAEIEFRVATSTAVTAGTLLGQAAEIRFRPVASVIIAGDGTSLRGFGATHRYREVGLYLAQAVVTYQVDYRLGSGSWVLNAAVLDSVSNTVSVQILERRKRTLLID
jgi:hypothetical protein